MSDELRELGAGVPLPDPILPPVLAFAMGREAARKAPYWTGEGFIMPGVARDGLRVCECIQHDEPALSTCHPKGTALPSDAVRVLLRRHQP